MKTDKTNKADFDAARKKLQGRLSAFMRAAEADVPAIFISASVYQKTTPEAKDIAVIATDYTTQDTPDHRSFVESRIRDQRVSIYGTSVGDAVQSAQTVTHGASGYRADHHCLNLKAGESIVQLVFKEPQLTEAEWQTTGKKLTRLFNASALKKEIADFTRVYGGHLNDFMPLPASEYRQAFLMFCDVSGYSRILPEAGAEKAGAFARELGERMTKVAAAYGGELVRSEGDGFWIAFPTTDFSKEERDRLYAEKVRPAAKAIIDDYKALREGYPLDAVQRSYMKVAVAYSDMTVASQRSRYHLGTMDGEAFIEARRLTSRAPRDKDTIVTSLS